MKPGTTITGKLKATRSETPKYVLQVTDGNRLWITHGFGNSMKQLKDVIKQFKKQPLFDNRSFRILRIICEEHP